MHGRQFLAVIWLLCGSAIAFGQAQKSGPIAGTWGVGVGIYYFHPNIDKFNDGFLQAENDLRLRPWQPFEISYLAITRFSYALDGSHVVGLQAGGSTFMRSRSHSEIMSRYSVGLLGGEYQYILLTRSQPKSRLALSAGAGLASAQFHRSYGNDVALNESAGTYFISAGAEFRVNITPQISSHLDVGYLYIPEMSFEHLGGALQLNSLIIGVGFDYAL
jgi:hypothetical protein